MRKRKERREEGDKKKNKKTGYEERIKRKLMM